MLGLNLNGMIIKGLKKVTEDKADQSVCDSHSSLRLPTLPPRERYDIKCNGECLTWSPQKRGNEIDEENKCIAYYNVVAGSRLRIASPRPHAPSLRRSLRARDLANANKLLPLKLLELRGSVFINGSTSERISNHIFLRTSRNGGLRVLLSPMR